MPFGIVTNGPPTQLLKIRHLGLDKLTDCIQVSQLVGYSKPEPAIFLAAAACLNVEPGAMLFVGDDPRADILGAAAIGMRTAWLHRGRQWPAVFGGLRPDYVIGNIMELLTLPGFPTT